MNTRRPDRFAAALCFLLAFSSLAIAAFSVIDFVHGCSVFRHGCFYVALFSPIFLAITVGASLAGLLLWPQRASSPYAHSLGHCPAARNNTPNAIDFEVVVIHRDEVAQ